MSGGPPSYSNCQSFCAPQRSLTCFALTLPCPPATYTNHNCCQAAMYLGFSVFLVGWMFQVGAAALSYTHTQ